MRKIVVNGKTFQYRIGKESVVFRNTHKKSFFADFSEITGWSWNDIERGMWKKYFSITPHQIADYIRKSILCEN